MVTWIPAPPLESEPAIVKTIGCVACMIVRSKAKAKSGGTTSLRFTWQYYSENPHILRDNPEAIIILPFHLGLCPWPSLSDLFSWVCSARGAWTSKF